MLGINSFYISGFVLYVSSLSNYLQTSYKNEFYAFRDEWTEGFSAYFAIKVFIRKSLTDIEEDNLNENGFYLAQNYPNPFNPTTNIKYEIPITTNVSLKIFNVLGQGITTFVNEIKGPGSYEVKFNAIGLSSGIYIAILRADKYFFFRKMILTK